MTSMRLFEAIDFATLQHRGQLRKGTSIPYIVHCVSVGKMLMQLGSAEDVAIAGILHDVVEDTEAELEEVRQRFGSRVADLVDGVSEPDKQLPWRDRKEHAIAKARSTDDLELLAIKCADKLDNIQDMRHDHSRIGEKLWERFKAPRDKQLWYHTTLCDLFEQRLMGSPWEELAFRYRAEVAWLFP
ncbi:MAG: bifunctional (p)ppGpp synthetase/guanosine-3',5'-bis(diphosphate) 3'-pyrophosphohydrolase [Armatimonadetes bacterium]|nr:bifunctional (p)ppGpp synthetase/guanosine-3',5'-bis(diphosphate) 3'-pyrophosphohydrolase [Armatimonadota bacterium]